MSSVAVLGAGVDLESSAPSHARELIEKCDLVFTILSEEHAVRFLQGLRVRRLKYVAGSLRSDRARIDNYREIAESVVSEALAGHRVCYLTYGNPAIFDRISHLILEACDKAHVPCLAPPAASCIDAVFAHLRRDIAPALQVFDCTWMVRNDVAPTTAATLLLMQPAVFSSDAIVDVREGGPAVLRPLSEYLVRFYPADHPATFVRAPQGPNDPGYVRSTAVGSLHDGPAEDLLSTSIVVPPRNEHGRRGV